ncbi:peptidase M24, structural domain-containing protein [Radiomyces spectabilis]|uniref:peptidase M24, structural domain-containing protein n=1 Tax=Radiomyces spectabilis TaxID=64574 RepID=UPI00221EA37B|nr:peptidase M24, structural domain-containing protein [Radiomyces spectabilis]KAI8369526.1 peptidase M24, structural domain-containing protein [Radiomyces spectabilis]
MRSLDCLSTARRLPQQIQQRWFNSHHALRLPRHGVQAKEKKGASSRSNRWGNFQRLSPSSLATVNVREWERASVPDNIMKPPYAETGSSSKWQPDIPLNSADDALQLGQACQLAKQILQLGGSMCKPGVTTASIDEALHNAIIRHGAYPSPLNYMGFPKSVCTSVNNVIAHGIPDNRPLENGDIINIDVTVYLNGFHGDTSATFYVGDVDEKGRALVECTRESLDKAIAICGPGVPMKEIGRVICEHAHKHGFSVSDELSGHGIGREFHCLPLVYHHLNHDEGVMQPSMSFTIEPILCEGSAIGIMWPDQWTISTVDGGRSAQFEHTMIVTDDGVDVLTE